jgi:galactofuranosylgalactofuranosylrhamnosyl-N-acetylglucosaminyl-diphospho-decaprenol beta-1,5/1,6-galactofuranosyltransferase
VGKPSEARVETHDGDPRDGFRVVHRTIMRADQELDVRALYVGAVTSMAGSGDVGQSGSDSKAGDSGGSSESATPAADSGMIGYGRIDDDDSTVAEPGRRLTFGTYFNAFPASYWRRWTDHKSVRLIARVRGEGSLIVYRSTARGHVLRTEGVEVSGNEAVTITLDLTLAPFIDGGWYWFDLEAGDGELVLEEAEWLIETDIEPGRVTIGITTFNRPDFCADQLVALSQDPATMEYIDEIIVVDQGNQKVVDTQKYAEAKAILGDRLRIIDQPNLGGSGGFSRSMFETVQRGASDYILLLDDDVVCELEGIKRAVAFGDLAKQPTIVGGHMFSLYDRTVMHAYGEALAKWTWFWGPAPATKHSHDWARRPLRSTPWLHRRIDVDYNGWWMCLIPTRVVRDIGLSLPMFIKWDDAEFGLRAGAAGYPTASLPGVAVWHVPWTEKDDTLDWQAYFHERNRLVSALMHSPYDHGGRLVVESLTNHVKRLVSMQYGTGEIIMMALQDVLAGPEGMHRDMAQRLPQLRGMAQNYPDSRTNPALDLFPPPRMKKPPRKGKGIPNPTNFAGKVTMAATGLVRQVTAPRAMATDHPEGIVPHVDQKWFRLAHFDSAIVSTADGNAAAWYRRDRREFMEQFRRSSALHARLYQEWPELSARYREALGQLTSPEAWKSSFEGLDG